MTAEVPSEREGEFINSSDKYHACAYVFLPLRLCPTVASLTPHAPV